MRGVLAVNASHGAGSDRASSNPLTKRTSAEWICLAVTKVQSAASSAPRNRRRFSITFSRSSWRKFRRLRASAGNGLTPPMRVLKAPFKPTRSIGALTSSRKLRTLRKQKCSISNVKPQIPDLKSRYDRRRRRRHSRNFADRTRDWRIRRALHQSRLHRTRNRLLRARRPQSRTLRDSLRRERGGPESPRRRYSHCRALLA